MTVGLRARLSAMMFLQFFVWGAWYVTAPRYLTRVGFTGDDIGTLYTLGPIAGMISPLLVGMVADRFFAAERIIGVLHLAGAALLYAATQMMTTGAEPSAINWTLQGYMLCYFPTLALTNSLAMRNVDDAQRQFPSIRVLGTIGWITAGSTLALQDWGASVNQFHLAAATSAVLGVYSFTLPNTPPGSTGPINVKALLGFDALVLLRRPSFAIFMTCSFLICIPLAFYYQMAERAVQAGGLENTEFKMTFGQASEVLFMLVMPLCFARLGVKWMLATGMLAWVVRYALFAIGVPDQIAWMLIVGIVLHGICYDFFFVTGQIYVDRVAPKEIRSQAQGLLVLFTLGLGMFFGARIAGDVETENTPAAAVALRDEVTAVHAEVEALKARIAAGSAEAGAETERDRLTAEENRLALAQLRAIDWGPIWRFPAIAAALVLALFLMVFRDRRDEAET